jgi:spore germination protein KA
MGFWLKLVKKFIQSNFEIDIKDINKDKKNEEPLGSQRGSNKYNASQKSSENTDNAAVGRLSYSLDQNETAIRQIFDKCFDFVVREINIANNPAYRARVMYLANLIPKTVLEENVISILTSNTSTGSPKPGTVEYTMSLLGSGFDDAFEEISKVSEAIIEGNAIVLVDGVNKGLVTALKEPPSRTIGEPEAEKVVRGPREGFIETLAVNAALVRKKIKSVDLKMELFKVGKQTRTDVVICYMQNLADKSIVEEAKRRINKIDIDSVLDSNYIAEYIQDRPINIIPTILRTEKPDVVAGKLLEGRVVVMVDGSPIALSVPSVFPELMMTSEDYYQSPVLASVLRLMRYMAFFVSLTLPALYVSLITFHSELLPSKLVLTIIRSRTTVPFSAIVEAALMILTFSILQEADIRIPKSMGQAVSVVGALVLGQAAVSAGIVSAPMVIVAAFAGISGLAVPEPEMQLALIYLRMFILIASGFLGLVGATCAILILLIYLTSQRSFGVPFMMPISPINFKGLTDSIIRIPLWMMKHRPSFINWGGGTRRKGRQNPDKN